MPTMVDTNNSVNEKHLRAFLGPGFIVQEIEVGNHQPGIQIIRRFDGASIVVEASSIESGLVVLEMKKASAE